MCTHLMDIFYSRIKFFKPGVLSGTKLVQNRIFGTENIPGTLDFPAFYLSRDFIVGNIFRFCSSCIIMFHSVENSVKYSFKNQFFLSSCFVFLN